MNKFLLLLVFSLIAYKAFSDELVYIQTVSNTQKSFIIDRGANHDIVVGMRRAFSTNRISIICEAIELGPTSSLWSVLDTYAAVPFERGQIILFHSTLKGIMKEFILEKDEKFLEKLSKLGLYQRYNSELEAKYMGTYKLLLRPKWAVRTNFSRSFYNSLSSVDAENESVSSGLFLELLYHRILFTHKLDLGVGIRHDRESEKVDRLKITVPTKRTMIISEISYHFNRFVNTFSNIYMGLGLGAGKTSSIVDNRVKSGSVLAVPYGKIGLLSFIKKKYFLVVELGLENLYSTERFSYGDEQTTSIINGKLTVGFRFDFLQDFKFRK